jgi:hypothetical protein
MLCFKKMFFIFLVYELYIYVCQFSHNFAPFWPAWMSDGCYSGAVATGVAHFDFLITLLVAR